VSGVETYLQFVELMQGECRVNAKQRRSYTSGIEDASGANARLARSERIATEMRNYTNAERKQIDRKMIAERRRNNCQAKAQ
jgi:hypothetical protein